MTKKKENKISTRAVLRLVGLGVLLSMLVYADGVRTRMSAKYAGTSVSTKDGGIYIADYYWHYYDAYGLVKVYRASDGVLLAEREFLFAEDIEMIWEKDRLMYGNNDKSIFHDGQLALPPGVMDRISAFIP